MRSWRAALDTISYHNAYRVSATYTPKSETEKVLQNAIKQLEAQSRERVDLLEALRRSRTEKDIKDIDPSGVSLTPTSTATSATTATTLTPAPPATAAGPAAVAGSPSSSSASALKGKFNFKLPLSSSFSNSSKTQASSGTNTNATTTTTPSSSSSSTTAPGWIGDGTIPAVDYADLSKPPLLPRRPPLPQTRPSNESITEVQNQNPFSTDLESQPARMPSTSSRKSIAKSRSSSTERQHTPPMLSTLRNKEPKKQAKKKSSPKRKELSATGPAASQAAGLAWDSIYRSPSFSDKTTAANDAALASSRLTTSNEAGFRKDPPEPRSHSGDGLVRSKRRTPVPAPAPAPVEDPGDQIPRAHWREPADPAIRRVPVSSRGKPSSSATAGSPNYPPPPPPPRRSSPKPTVRPKPDLLKSQQTEAANARSSSAKPTGWTLGTTSSSGPPLSRTRATPTSSGKVYRSSGNKEDSLLGAMNRLDVSGSRPTPPSSDPESPAPQSTDAEDGELGNEKNETHDETHDEDENEDEDAYMEVMNRLPRGVDAMAARQILNDIVVRGDEVHWDDIAGLEAAKKALKEAVVYPFLRPDLFSGLREPARGMLLFGPPGTGKTMLARAVATESKSTFFSVSASTLTSKWHGDSEKLVRALFGLAKALAPSIIFVDEIDSLLSARSSGTENEASRRSKTEFLIQWSDLQRAAAGREQGKESKKIGDASRVLVLAATNMPWDIDEAARRRFVRRQYIPLPESGVRGQQIRKLLSHQVYELSDEDIEVLVHVTEGMSFFSFLHCPTVSVS